MMAVTTRSRPALLSSALLINLILCFHSRLYLPKSDRIILWKHKSLTSASSLCLKGHIFFSLNCFSLVPHLSASLAKLDP